GWLDQRAVRSDFALLLQIQDHGDADTVLHAAQRVEELELQHEVGDDALLLAEPRRTHKRRVADRLDDAVVDAPAAGRVEVRLRCVLLHEFVLDVRKLRLRLYGTELTSCLAPCGGFALITEEGWTPFRTVTGVAHDEQDRKSTRLNSS